MKTNRMQRGYGDFEIFTGGGNLYISTICTGGGNLYISISY